MPECSRERRARRLLLGFAHTIGAARRWIFSEKRVSIESWSPQSDATDRWVDSCSPVEAAAVSYCLEPSFVAARSEVEAADSRSAGEDSLAVDWPAGHIADRIVAVVAAAVRIDTAAEDTAVADLDRRTRRDLNSTMGPSNNSRRHNMDIHKRRDSHNSRHSRDNRI